jgi:hypothetical protein
MNRKGTAIRKCGIPYSRKGNCALKQTGLTKSDTAIVICSTNLETESTTSKVFKVERRS